jgi:hypothetical protein
MKKSAFRASSRFQGSSATSFGGDNCRLRITANSGAAAASSAARSSSLRALAAGNTSIKPSTGTDTSAGTTTAAGAVFQNSFRRALPGSGSAGSCARRGRAASLACSGESAVVAVRLGDGVVKGGLADQLSVLVDDDESNPDGLRRAAADGARPRPSPSPRFTPQPASVTATIRRSRLIMERITPPTTATSAPTMRMTTHSCQR